MHDETVKDEHIQNMDSQYLQKAPVKANHLSEIVNVINDDVN